MNAIGVRNTDALVVVVVVVVVEVIVDVVVVVVVVVVLFDFPTVRNKDFLISGPSLLGHSSHLG